MPELRWILIGFAVVLLAGIYLWGRRNDDRESRSESISRARPEPTLFSDELAAGGHASPSFDDVINPEPDYAPEPESNSFDAEVTVERKVESARPTSTARPESVANPSRMVDPRVADSRVTEAPEVERTPDFRRRVEPTLGTESAFTAELPVEDEEPVAPAREEAAPTLSSTDTPTPRRADRRKILSLRLAAAPHRIEGAKLAEVFATERLTHGKYEIFHRLHDAHSSIFCVASMVEPGTFDLEKMSETQYTGITMFAQLPGPVPGMHALNELVACARRLQQSLGGTLQDDRGVPLTVHRIERLRQEVREFERPSPSAHRTPR